MPLNPDAEKLIRKHLKKARNGKRTGPVSIGTLTDKQLADLNAERHKRNLEPMVNDVKFTGRHIHDRRVVVDGYSTTDVITQIKSAMAIDSVIKTTPKMTVLQSIRDREDGFGNVVRDEVVLECTGRFPHPELYSVIPKGDAIKPCKTPTANGGRNEATPIRQA